MKCALLKPYPPKLYSHLSNNIQSRLNAEGAKQDIENCILAPRFHPRPSGDDDDDNKDDGDKHN